MCGNEPCRECGLYYDHQSWCSKWVHPLLRANVPFADTDAKRKHLSDIEFLNQNLKGENNVR